MNNTENNPFSLDPPIPPEFDASWLEGLDLNLDLFDEDQEEVESEVEESKNLFIEAKSTYNKVDDKLLVFIDNFVVNQNNAAKQKKQLKDIFFWFTMISFALIVITPIICLVALMCADVYDYYIIFGAIVASLVEVLTTIIILPKIVAEYLFNKKEENSNIKIVELMQKYSEMIHGYDKDS